MLVFLHDINTTLHFRYSGIYFNKRLDIFIIWFGCGFFIMRKVMFFPLVRGGNHEVQVVLLYNMVLRYNMMLRYSMVLVYSVVFVYNMLFVYNIIGNMIFFVCIILYIWTYGCCCMV